MSTDTAGGNPGLSTAKLGALIEQAAGGKPVKARTIEQLAREHGVPASRLYIAAAARPTIQFARENKVSFVVCVGNCLGQGGMACLDHLVEVRQARARKWFTRTFDLEPRACLNRCDFSPAIRVDSKDGSAVLEKATTDDLDEAIEAFCG